MFKILVKTAVLLCVFIFSSSSIDAQKVLYRNASFNYRIQPTKANLQVYKTFDLTFRNEMESFFGNDKKEDVKFTPKMKDLQLVENSDELHVHSTLYYLTIFVC